jgi:DNA-binding transcriptional ArsR family regulator
VFVWIKSRAVDAPSVTKQTSTTKEKLFGGSAPKLALLTALFGTPPQTWAMDWWTEGDLVRELGVSWKSTGGHLAMLTEFGLLDDDSRSTPRRWRLSSNEQMTPSQRRVRDTLTALIEALESAA